MPEPDDITEPQQALVFLCQWLSATTREESDKRFKAYYEYLVPLLTRFCLLQYSFDEAQAAVALAEAMSDHVEKVLLRPGYAVELTSQLNLSQPIGDDQALKDRFLCWRRDVNDTVTQAMTLHDLVGKFPPAELEQHAKATNTSLTKLAGSGARLLQITMEWQGLKLSCFKTSIATDAIAEGDDSIDDLSKEGSLPGYPAGSADMSVKADAESALEGAAAKSVDRLYWHVMDLDPEDRRTTLLEKRGLKDLKKSGSPEAQEFFCGSGEVLYKLARLRMPMLGLLYRSIRTRAIDAARRASRMVSLDEFEESEEGSGGPAAVQAGGQNVLASASSMPDVDGNSQFNLVVAARLAAAIEEQLMQPVRDTEKALEAAKTDRARESLAERLKVAQVRCEFHIEVFQLETQGYTQTKIAEMLDSTRDKVRTALKHIDAAIGRDRSKLDGDDAQDTPDDGETE